ADRPRRWTEHVPPVHLRGRPTERFIWRDFNRTTLCVIPGPQQVLARRARIRVADRQVVARDRLDIKDDTMVLDLPRAALPGQRRVHSALVAVAREADAGDVEQRPSI